uniref:Uncharacterized protein n=1 Tax=Prymnesium polylepis TaxID=72548 RepID=A0A7S4J7L9_9EUKA
MSFFSTIPWYSMPTMWPAQRRTGGAGAAQRRGFAEHLPTATARLPPLLHFLRSGWCLSSLMVTGSAARLSAQCHAPYPDCVGGDGQSENESFPACCCCCSASQRFAEGAMVWCRSA